MKLTRYDKPLTAPPETAGPGRPINPDSYHSLGKKYGINYGTLRNRLQRGMTLEEAVSKPVLTRKQCGERAASARWGE